MLNLKCPKLARLSSRTLALTLALTVVLSTIFGSTVDLFKVFAADLTAGDSHIVFSDEFTGSSLGSDWKWVASGQGKDSYTATVSDGKLGLVSDGGSLLTSMRYLNAAQYEHLNQRVAVTYTAKATNKPVVWARFDAPNASVYGQSGGYYAFINYNTSGGGSDVVVNKRGDNYAPGGVIGNAGKVTITDGDKIKLEMTVTGSAPTLVSVYAYKIDGSGNEKVISHANFVDNTASLQDAGTAGVASTHNTGGTVEIESFEYSSTDNVKGNYYVSKKTNPGSKTFGQWVTLDPTKTYIYAVDSNDNGTHEEQGYEMVDPLWVEVRKNSNGDYNRILTDRTKLSTNRSKENLGDSGVEYNKTFTLYYEFDLSQITSGNIYLDSGYDNKAQALVGFRLQSENYSGANYTNFRLYAKDDAKRTNLLVNPDFKMGMYGWNDNAGGYSGYTVGKESALTGSADYAEIKSKPDGEFAEFFKNTSYDETLADPTAGEPHTVYADEFNSSLGTDWKWVASGQGKDSYTATVSGGKLGLAADGGSLLTSMRYLDPAKHERLNQRVAVTYTAKAANKPVLWARFDAPSATAYGASGGYYVTINYNMSGDAEVVLSKRCDNYASGSGEIGKAGKVSVTDGDKIKLEMTVTGSAPTVINVYTYKIDGSGNEKVAAHATFVDNEASLQDAGSVGVSATHNTSGTVEIESLEYTTSDNVRGNYYVSKKTNPGSKTFGQWVTLDPTKTYIYAVDSKDNGKHKDYGYEMVDPLWVELRKNFDGDSYRILTDRTKLSSNRDEDTLGDSGVEYNEIFSLYYEFDLSTIDLGEIYIDSAYDGMVQALVGFRLQSENYSSADYTNFRLYAKDDANKTNLLVNSDFKMGMYGWSDNAIGYTAYTIGKESVLTGASNYAEIKSKSKGEYQEFFKNNDYKVNLTPKEGQLVVHNTGAAEYKRFGTVMMLDPAETYVYSVSYKYIEEKGSRPIVEYKNDKNEWKELGDKSDDKTYFRTSMEFKIPENAKLVEGKAELRIGFTTGQKNSDTYFGNFDLHTKSAPTTNLFDKKENANFNNGLYGWFYGGTEITVSGELKTSDGAIEIVVKEDDFFKRPPWNELEGKWVLHTTGKLAYARVGQIVYLEPGKSYIYSVSYKEVDKKGSRPLVSYDKGGKYELIDVPKENTIEDKNYFRTSYEFTVPNNATITDGKVKMQICISTGEEGSDIYWGDFELCEKSNPGTNLLVNPDFKWGFYGWTSRDKNDQSYNEYGLTQLLRGEAELVQVDDDFFKRPAWSELTGFWGAHTTGKVKYARFGQILNLSPEKTYVYSVYYKNEDQLGSRPLIEYEVLDSENKTAFAILDDYKAVEDEIYYKTDMEFKLPKNANVVDGKVKVRLGITTGQEGADVYYANFLVYDKFDDKKTNLFQNADFKLGLFGWTSNGYNLLPISEYGTKITKEKDVELKELSLDFFKRPAWEKFTEEPMFHITGKANYAHPGQIIELEAGQTYYYSMYEKYFAQNSCQPMAFVKKNGNYDAVAKELSVQSEDPQNCFKVYKFTVPKDSDIEVNGKTKVLVGFTTGITGADAYFYDLQLYNSKDAKKTNLFINPDFEYGLFGWTGSYYNHLPETEYGARVFRYSGEAELLPYDASIFVNDSSDEFFDDGDWAAKFGADETFAEWLKRLGISGKDDGSVMGGGSAGYLWIYITAAAVVLLGALAGFIVFFVKRKKNQGAS